MDRLPVKVIQLDIEYMKAELSRVDVYLRQAISRWQRAGQDPADAFRGLYVSDEQAGSLLNHPFSTNWGDTIALSSAEEARYHEAERAAKQQANAFAAQACAQNIPLRLIHLRTAFQLDDFAFDTLLICLAPSLDLRYEIVYGYLQDDISRKRPTINLVLDLLCASAEERCQKLIHFNGEWPLFKYHFLSTEPENHPTRQPLLRRSLHVDETVVSWLFGLYQPPAKFTEQISLAYPQETEADAQITGEAVTEWVATNHQRLITEELPIIVFYGPDRVRQLTAARLLAARWKRPLLAVNLTSITQALGEDQVNLRMLRSVLRDAQLTGAILHLTGWDSCLQNGKPRSDLLVELFSHSDLIIISGQALWQPQDIVRERKLFHVHFPSPDYEHRQRLWLHFLDKAFSPEMEISALAGQFQLKTGQIQDAVASAKDRAAQQNRCLQNEDLFVAARAHSNPNLASLARKISPRYGWADIVLPDDQLLLLRELVNTVRQRAQVLDTWGVGQKLVSSRGVTALFSGPPGTGKTMAAEIIAGELGLDLYKIDLSTVISKYIGETEKNLERIFDEAASSNAILFFDEADALFGKRSEVRDSHDRYANIEISYLLQRMEAYDGVTMLATNLRANLDEAFTRRLQFAVDFPFPEEDYRLRIWHTLFPQEVPRAAEIDFNLLAHRFRLAGGNIRNILVSAAYLAACDGQCVTMSHLLHGMRRELQKMGRLITEDQLT